MRINRYVSFVSIFCFSSCGLENSNKLGHSFQGECGTQTVKYQPSWLPCCLPAKEMNGMLMRSLGRHPHSYGNVAAGRALGHEEANVWELWGKLQMIRSLRKMPAAPTGRRMLCRGPVTSPSLLESTQTPSLLKSTQTEIEWYRYFLQPPRR